MSTVKKLVDRRDIIRDLHENVTPKYYPANTLTANRVSGYGWLIEAEAAAIEDTITLEQHRVNDYSPELSSSEEHVNQVAKLRGVGINRATPGRCFAFMGVLKTDVLNKGIKSGNDIIFRVDRRSSILYNKINCHFNTLRLL